MYVKAFIAPISKAAFAARSMVAFLLAIIFVTASACSSSSSELIGYTPPTEKNVSSVSATEITPTGEQSFNFIAPSNEVLIVYFGYTNCPDLCPTTLAAIRNAKRQIGEQADRVKLAMVTVDPERDTKDILPSYLESFSDQYHALIPASEDELIRIKDFFQASSSITKNSDGSVEVGHSTTTYVVTDAGIVIVEWPYGLTADDMAHDLKILLKK
jgi:cytochrome oxidase Cu insertion factor (SCO1/SenC/PrrC family)